MDLQLALNRRAIYAIHTFWFHLILSVLILSKPTLAIAAPPEPDLQVIVFHNQHLDDEAIIQMAGVAHDPQIQAIEVKRRLETSGLFSRVIVSRTSTTMIITVEEKTTWMILPYLSSNSSQTVYGLATGKASAFGQNSNILGRFQMGRSNKEGSLLLRDEYFLNTPWLAGLNFDFENSLHQVYAERKIAQTTRNQYWGTCPQAGYHLNPHTLLVLNSCFEKHTFEEIDYTTRSGTQISHKVTLESGRFFSNEGLSHGQIGKIYFEIGNPIADFSFRKLGISGQFGMFLKGNLNWILRPKFEAGAGLPRYQLFELGGIKLRSFPGQQFRDRHYSMVQNDIFLSAIDTWKVILRPLLYIDWVMIQNSGRTGVGVGMNIYFQKIAIPALQLYGGYGANPNGYSAALAIGPQF